MNLANYAQFEREMISERTRDALRHLKSQGVRLGPAPYGYALSDDTDAHGRRLLQPIPNEQEVVQRIKNLRTEGHSFAEIAGLLNAEGIAARRNGTWRANRVWIMLQREGMHIARRNRPHIPRRYDPEAATEIAQKLRMEGVSLEQIGKRLWKEKLTPQRGGKWHPAQVAKLLEQNTDRQSAARRACELRAEGMTLKEIGVRLTMEGFAREDGRVWYPSLVRTLLLHSEQEFENSQTDKQN